MMRSASMKYYGQIDDQELVHIEDGGNHVGEVVGMLGLAPGVCFLL
jgi:hypothetical protein